MSHAGLLCFVHCASPVSAFASLVVALQQWVSDSHVTTLLQRFCSDCVEICGGFVNGRNALVVDVADLAGTLPPYAVAAGLNVSDDFARSLDVAHGMTMQPAADSHSKALARE